jgi:hypothetical protein
MRMTMHKCPKTGCPVSVSNRLFACGPHWAELTQEVKAEIYRTVRLPLLNPVRLAAIQAAREDWADSVAATESDPIS